MAIAIDENGRAASMHVDNDGNLKIAGTFSAEPPEGAATDAKLDEVITAIEGITIDPPVGGATSAKQDTIIAGLSSIDGRVDGIETLLGTSNTNTAGVKFSVDSLSAKVELHTEYETVAASQTTQTLGSTGAAGDYLDTLVVIVTTAATAQVQIKDGSNSAITVFPNSPGAGVGTYHVALGIKSVQGAWQVTTGAGVSVIATGNFT